MVMQHMFNIEGGGLIGFVRQLGISKFYFVRSTVYPHVVFILEVRVI